LKEAERPDAIRAIAILYPPEDFPFQYGHERKKCEEHSQQRKNIDQTRRNLHQPIGRMRHRGKQRLLSPDKYLIERIRHLR
jgi:hypothetical protein